MEEIYQKLDNYAKDDVKPEGGRLFTYFYDSGVEDLKKFNEIYLRFLNKNGMDYRAFPSTLQLENDVVAMISSLLGGDDGVAGNFTTGGTESIMIAMKAARDLFLSKEENSGKIPEIIIPVTAHPAFRKAAEYLGMKSVVVPVDKSSFLVDPDEVVKAIGDSTCVIVASAPSFPYGGIDPIEELGKISLKYNLWLHVDACVGGFILPFLKKLGISIKNFDFSVPGVNSISVDLHKYGFTPKGASVILYKNKKLRKHQLYVNASWPGYPMSNIGIQATKSAGPLAASWAILHYLGEDRYLELAKKSLRAKEKIAKGVQELGFQIVGNPESTIFAFSSDSLDIFEVASILREKGWFLQVQPGSVELGIPPSLHLNSNPVHEKASEEFLKSLKEVVTELSSKKKLTFSERLGKLGIDLEADLSKKENVVKLFTSPESPLKKDRTLLYEFIRHLPPDVIEEAFKEMVNDDFSPTKK